MKFFFIDKEKFKQEKLSLNENKWGSRRINLPIRWTQTRFKESAIFFADSVEAAARSLPKVTQHSIEELLDSIFNDRLEDGQLMSARSLCRK